MSLKVTHSIVTAFEGPLKEVEDAKAKPLPSLEEVLKILREVTFIAETVAHLQGKESAILPTTDKAREIIAAFNTK